MNIRMRLGFHRLRNKILLLCLSLILIGVACCAFILFRSFEQVKLVYDTSTRELMEVQSGMLFSNLKMQHEHVTRLCSDSDFRQILVKQASRDQGTPDIYALSAMSTLIGNAVSGLKYVRSCMIVTSHGTYFQLSQGYRKSFDFSATELAKKLSGEENRGVWYGVAQRDELYKFSGDVIPIIYRMSFPAAREKVTVIMLLDEWSVYKSLNSQNGHRGQTLLLNELGQQVLSPHHFAWETMLDEDGEHTLKRTEQMQFFWADGREYIVHRGARSADIPWRLITLMDRNSLMSSMMPSVYLIMLILLTAVALSMLVSVSVSKSITKPIVELSRAMETVHTLPVRIKLSENNSGEAGLLAQKFNKMADQLNLYDEQLRKEKEKAKMEQMLKRQAELKALQAQINPHFLYNTLDSISWMAYNAGQENISSMTVALAELFRVSLSHGRELITLADEFRHVTNYLKIQKMRYKDQFDFECVLPESMRNLATVKLILQPLAENSIYHGIRESGQKGLIRVSAQMEGNGSLRLIVEDNGAGFMPGNLRKINRDLRNGLRVDADSYGIFNVNERIRLCFGENWGLQYAEKKRRTLAVISMPALSEKVAEKYEQRADH